MAWIELAGIVMFVAGCLIYNWMALAPDPWAMRKPVVDLHQQRGCKIGREDFACCEPEQPKPPKPLPVGYIPDSRWAQTQKEVRAESRERYQIREKPREISTTLQGLRRR